MKPFLLSLPIAAIVPAILLLGNPSPAVQLSGEWVATVYADSLVGQRHGAYWNGYNCTDYLGRPLPDRVTVDLMGLAMPGAEFYCLPVVVCNGDRCVTGTALDVPADHRIEKDGQLYEHIDLMPAMAKALEVDGLQYGNLRVYVRQ